MWRATMDDVEVIIAFALDILIRDISVLKHHRSTRAAGEPH